MTIKPNTTAGSNETVNSISESELFAKFFKVGTVQARVARNGFAYEAVSDYIWGFEIQGLEELLQAMVTEISDEQSGSNPEDYIELAINELKGAAQNLETVLEEFRFFKAEYALDENDAEGRSIETDRFRDPEARVATSINADHSFAQACTCAAENLNASAKALDNPPHGHDTPEGVDWLEDGSAPKAA